MLPLSLAQIFNPPIINIPPPKPSKWYETHRFWNGIVIGIGFAGWAFGMTKHIVWAHIFFAAAWACGSFLSLWVFSKDVFPSLRWLAWSLLSLLLAGIIAVMDFYAVHL